MSKNLFICLFLFVSLAMACRTSPTRDQTRSPCSGRAESEVEPQGSPVYLFLRTKSQADSRANPLCLNGRTGSSL